MSKKKTSQKYTLVLVSVLVMLTVTAVPFVNAEPLTKNIEIKEKMIGSGITNSLMKLLERTDKKFNVFVNYVYKLDNKDKLTAEYIDIQKVKDIGNQIGMNTTLHDMCLILYELLALIFGHNTLTYLTVVLLTIWWIYPIVFIDCMMTTGGSGSFQEIFHFYWDTMNIEEYIFRYGIFGYFAVAFWFIFIFIGSLIESIGGSTGSMGQRIQDEIDEIYNFPFY
jgi:hypothetical protein